MTTFNEINIKEICSCINKNIKRIDRGIINEVFEIVKHSIEVPIREFDISLISSVVTSKLRKKVDMLDVLTALEYLYAKGMIDKSEKSYFFSENYTRNMIKNVIINILLTKKEMKANEIIETLIRNDRYKYSKSYIYKVIKDLEKDEIIETVSKRPKIIKLKNIKNKKRKI